MRRWCRCGARVWCVSVAAVVVLLANGSALRAATFDQSFFDDQFASGWTTLYHSIPLGGSPPFAALGRAAVVTGGTTGFQTPDARFSLPGPLNQQTDQFGNYADNGGVWGNTDGSASDPFWVLEFEFPQLPAGEGPSNGQAHAIFLSNALFLVPNANSFFTDVALQFDVRDLFDDNGSGPDGFSAAAILAQPTAGGGLEIYQKGISPGATGRAQVGDWLTLGDSTVFHQWSNFQGHPMFQTQGAPDPTAPTVFGFMLSYSQAQVDTATRFALAAADNFQVRVRGEGGFAVTTWDGVIASVPEPGAAALLALGMAAVWLARRPL